ncbi:hypothetical protein BDW75DRAFT_224957 [Aspergillus navahoensis]
MFHKAFFLSAGGLFQVGSHMIDFLTRGSSQEEFSHSRVFLIWHFQVEYTHVAIHTGSCSYDRIYMTAHIEYSSYPISRHRKCILFRLSL